MPVNDPSNALTPSEVIFLNADRFKSEPGLTQVRATRPRAATYSILDTKVTVSRFALAPLVLAAALLAVEAAGNVHLEVRPRKLYLGLHTRRCLYADPGPEAGPWPEDTLESAIQATARRLPGAKGANVVEDIVYGIFHRGSPDPFGRVCDLVRDGLAGRGLVEANAGDRLVERTVYRYHLLQDTADAAADRLGEARALLAGCQDKRPEVWSSLIREVSRGLFRRSTGER
jgi:hypothetical protein